MKIVLKGAGILFLLVVALLVFSPSAREIVTVTYLNTLNLTSFEVQADEPEKLYMSGEINSKTFDQIQEVIKNNPQITTIVQLEMPGSLDDETNFKMCRWIREQGLSTYLTKDSHVASGATDFFLAGVHRYYEKGAKVGVHSWSDGVKEAKEFPKDSEEHEMNRLYVEEMLGQDDFYWYTIYAASADDIYYMTLEEMNKYKIITDFVEIK